MSYIPTRAYTPRDPTLGIRTLVTTGTTASANVAEAGILHGIGVRVVAAPSGACTVLIKITVDGGTTTNLSLYGTGTTFIFYGLVPGHGDGSLVGDSIFFPFNSPYNSTLLVEAEVTAGTGGTGQIYVTTVRSTRNT